MLGTAWAEAPPPHIAPLPSTIPFYHPILPSLASPGMPWVPGAAPLLRSPRAGGPRVLPTPLLGPFVSLGLWERGSEGGHPWVVSVLGQGERGRALPGAFYGGKLG